MAGARLDKRGEEGGVVTRTNSTMGGEDIGVSQTEDNTRTCVLQAHDIILYMYISIKYVNFIVSKLKYTWRIQCRAQGACAPPPPLLKLATSSSTLLYASALLSSII